MFKTFIIALLLLVTTISAQKAPAKSPAATVNQTIGHTKVDVTYSRPVARGREIFGSLVKYDKVWRTGANACTTIEFDKDVTIGGKKVAKGKYSLFTIPTKGSWTFIINKKLGWGSNGYTKDEDVIRVKAMTSKMSNKAENFTISFSNVDGYEGTLDIAWANTKASVKINTK